MALKAGSIHDVANSMAQAMEDAFREEWPNAMGQNEPPEINLQMRLLFVAVAKGVVRHLVANNGAFTVTVNPAYIGGIGSHVHGTNVSIDGE